MTSLPSQVTNQLQQVEALQPRTSRNAAGVLTSLSICIGHTLKFYRTLLSEHPAMTSTLPPSSVGTRKPYNRERPARQTVEGPFFNANRLESDSVKERSPLWNATT